MYLIPESEYLESVREKLGGALVLKMQKSDDKSLGKVALFHAG